MKNHENMNQSSLANLPESQFYLLADARDDALALYREHQLDRLELWTGDTNPESVEIYERVRKKYAEFEGAMVSHSGDEIYRNPLFSYSADMVHTESFFETRKPEQLDHIEEIACRTLQKTGGEGSSYIVVSEEWKNAIESVEPSAHEFFPHVLNFRNATVPRYIFRSQIVVFDALTPISGATQSRREDMRNGLSVFEHYGWHPPEINKRPVAEYEVQTRKLESRNWITFPVMSYTWAPMTVVSQALAVKLKPLLPHRVVLLPLACA
jgi:hypothetical protein